MLYPNRGSGSSTATSIMYTCTYIYTKFYLIGKTHWYHQHIFKPTRNLTHWGWVTDICVSKLTINGSDNGLLSVQHQAIIWTEDGVLLIRSLKNKLQWNLTRNLYILIHENAYENVVSILSRPHYVNNTLRQLWQGSEKFFRIFGSKSDKKSHFL